MLMLIILVAVLIAMMGYALFRHWKARNDKATVANRYRPQRIVRRRP